MAVRDVKELTAYIKAYRVAMEFFGKGNDMAHRDGIDQASRISVTK